jgi:hypothetical protein
MHWLLILALAALVYFLYQGFVNASGPLAGLAGYNNNLPSDVG